MTYPNRFLCSVLGEMRNLHKTRNYSPLLGLIEEAQTLANRMEAAIDQKRDYYTLRDECKELDKKKRKLKGQIAKLEAEAELLASQRKEVSVG